MALSEQYLDDEIHPIDIVENLAAFNDWDFDRISDEQIAMAVEGQWRTSGGPIRSRLHGLPMMKRCG